MHTRPDSLTLRNASAQDTDGLSSSGESLISQSSGSLQTHLQSPSINELLMASHIQGPHALGQHPFPPPASLMGPPVSPAVHSPIIETVPQFLDRLNMQVYRERFSAEGFDTMIAVFEITEDDFAAMDVKRGHRRILQLEFARLRGYATNLPLHSIRTSPEDDVYSATSPRLPPNASPSLASSRPLRGQQGSSGEATGKRRYRRHPKPDPSAPDKPPSAYVAFSAAVREENKGKTFTELAKIVGDRWKNLDEATRTAYEESANASKEEWMAKMADYKRTDSYKKYQTYLLDFRERHPKQPASDRQTSVTERSTSDRQTQSGDRPGSESNATSPVYMDSIDKRERSTSPGPLTYGPKRLRTASFASDGTPDQFAGALGGTTLWNERAYQAQAGPSVRPEEFLPPRFSAEPLGLLARSSGPAQSNSSAYDRYNSGNPADHQSASVSTSYDRSTLAREE